ncbi:uncharacterized protein V1516DRAFT_626623 [Lipomyces oligophaga]|uniref:uncharacterized protein n=1 Tax=Lipomyces oligophaga TaxID=45792 RepID=UPI0034D0099F
MSHKYFPAVSPSSIAVGTLFSQSAALITLVPALGSAYERAKEAETPEKLLKSNHSADELMLWSSSLVSSAARSYAVSVLLQCTGTVTKKGAASLGLLLFAVSSAQSLLLGIFRYKRPLEHVILIGAGNLFDTVGLSMVLNWWGTRPPLV